MSLAEIKEEIVRKVILSGDMKFLMQLNNFINEKERDTKSAAFQEPENIDAFYDRLKGQYADVLQKLAQ